MEGIFNIFKKMAFLIFLLSQGVHLQDVHDLLPSSITVILVYEFVISGNERYISQLAAMEK